MPRVALSISAPSASVAVVRCTVAGQTPCSASSGSLVVPDGFAVGTATTSLPSAEGGGVMRPVGISKVPSRSVSSGATRHWVENGTVKTEPAWYEGTGC